MLPSTDVAFDQRIHINQPLVYMEPGWLVMNDVFIGFDY